MKRQIKALLKGPLAPIVGVGARIIEFWCRWTNRRTGIGLYYHRVGDPQGDPQRDVLPLLGTGLFEAQVRFLKRNYRLVPASELLESSSRRRRGQRFPVAITFDDDVPDHVREVMPILVKHGAPATFFLNGASLNRPSSFWWERLQRIWDREEPDYREVLQRLRPIAGEAERPRISLVSEAIQELSAEERRELSEDLAALAGPDPADAGIRSQDVARLVDAGFEIGFHTLHHDVLPNLDDRALADAMIEGRDGLVRASGGAPGLTSMISYPYGKADQRVAQAAREAGYSLGFTAYEQAVDADGDPMLIDRIDPLLARPGVLALKLARALLRQRRS